MTENFTSPAKGRVFYGWFALAGVMLVICVVGGAFTYAFAVLLPIISGEFEWSRGAVALALSLGILAFGLPSPVYGIFVDRFGPRFTIILGNSLAALGLAGVYLVQEVWHLYLLYVLMGLGGGFGGYIPSATVINNWFIKKRSLALGMFTACAGLGGFIFPPMTTALIDAIGWRDTWLVLAGLVLIGAVFIGGVILVRNKPEDMGLLPDNMPANAIVEVETKEIHSGTDEERSGWHIKQVLKQPTIWLIGCVAAANAFTMGLMMTHQIAYIQDIGFKAMTAATTVSVTSIFGITGSLLFGTLGLRYNVRYLASIAFGIQLVGLSILLSTRELGLIYIYAVCQGLGNGALITALPTFVGAYYRRDRYARVLGVVLPFQVVTNAISMTVAGIIYDATSAYTTAFAIAAVFSFSGIIVAFMTRRPKSASLEAV
jgi:MFS family permease